MKQVFLLFGIAAFSSASAQKDLFDIRKHIVTKQAEGKKAAENKRLTLPFNKPFTLVDHSLAYRPERSWTLPNGDRVIISELDNMPCIKPDMNRFRAMPNAGTGQRIYNYYPNKVNPGQIPNGGGMMNR